MGIKEKSVWVGESEKQSRIFPLRGFLWDPATWVRFFKFCFAFSLSFQISPRRIIVRPAMCFYSWSAERKSVGSVPDTSSVEI